MVSVLMSTYNRKDLLPEAIESVLNQSCLLYTSDAADEL